MINLGISEFSAWRLLIERFSPKGQPNILQLGYKSLRFAIRYERFTIAAAATVLQQSMFQAGRANFVRNNETAGKMGQFYGLYFGQAIALFSDKDFALDSDLLTIIQASEVEVLIGNKQYEPRTHASPFYLNWGNIGGMTTEVTTTMPTLTEFPITPRVSIPVRPDETIEPVFYWQTNPANDLECIYYLIGVEAHRADQG